MKYLAQVLRYFRSINLTAIGSAALSGLGWFGRIAGAFVLKALEIFLDGQAKELEEAIEQKQNDKAIDEKAKQNAQRIEQATNDDDFDNAVRDSLK